MCLKAQYSALPCQRSSARLQQRFYLVQRFAELLHIRAAQGDLDPKARREAMAQPRGVRAGNGTQEHISREQHGVADGIEGLLSRRRGFQKKSKEFGLTGGDLYPNFLEGSKRMPYVSQGNGELKRAFRGRSKWADGEPDYFSV